MANRFLYKHEKIQKGDIIFYSFNSWDHVDDVDYDYNRIALNPDDSVLINGNEIFVEDMEMVVRWVHGYNVYNYAPRTKSKEELRDMMKKKMRREIIEELNKKEYE